MTSLLRMSGARLKREAVPLLEEKIHKTLQEYSQHQSCLAEARSLGATLPALGDSSAAPACMTGI